MAAASPRHSGRLLGDQPPSAAPLSRASRPLRSRRYKPAGGETWKVSALLARRTLASCHFAWVGIAEDLALSLQLLKLELPDLFGKLDVAQFRWTPTSGSSRPGGDPSAANQSQHPYLRSHLLTHDYEVYDAERRRLFHRAQRHGIMVWGAPPAE